MTLVEDGETRSVNGRRFGVLTFVASACRRPGLCHEFNVLAPRCRWPLPFDAQRQPKWAFGAVVDPTLTRP